MRNFFILTILFFLIASCGRVEENIILGISPAKAGIDISDLTNEISRVAKEKFKKRIYILLINEENVYDEIEKSPASFINYFNQKGDKKYSFVIGIKAFSNVLKNRTEFEVMFASSFSEDDRKNYSSQSVISVYEIVKWLSDFDYSDPEKLKNIYIFGKKVNKLLILFNHNVKDSEKQEFQKRLEIIFKNLFPSGIEIKAVNAKFDLSNIINREYNPFEDDFFDEANRGIIFAVCPFLEENRRYSFFEVLLFSDKSSFKNIIKLSSPTDVENIVGDLAIYLTNRSIFYSDVAFYWKVDPNTLKRKQVCFLPYTEFVNLEGKYLLVKSASTFMPEGYLDRKDFFKDGISSDSKFITILENKIINERLLYLFENKNGISKRFIFFEYITTGKKLIKLAFGPLSSADNVEEYRKVFSKSGIIFENFVFSPADFR